MDEAQVREALERPDTIINIMSAACGHHFDDSCNACRLARETNDRLLREARAKAAHDALSSGAGGEGEREELARLREEVDRFRRPSARNLSTSDPIEPLPTFQPRHLLGLALLFREWCHQDMWGRPNEAELAARQAETAYLKLTEAALARPAVPDELRELVGKLTPGFMGAIVGAMAARAYRTEGADARKEACADVHLAQDLATAMPKLRALLAQEPS